MRIVWIILAAFGGGIAGFILTVIVASAVITAPAADSGGTAMGIFFTLGPLGAVAGAVIAALYVALRKRRGAGPDPAAKRGGQALVGLLAVAGILVGLWYWLFYTPYPDMYEADERAPRVAFEVVLPSAVVAGEDDFGRDVWMESWQHALRPEDLRWDAQGETTVVRGSIALVAKVADRVLVVQPSSEVTVRFPVPIAAEPAPEPGFGRWRPASSVDAAAVAALSPADFRIRTRVDPGT